MFAQPSALEGGFARPVMDAQAVFRTVMDAMARPARVVPLNPMVTPPAPLSPAAAAIACTLFDADADFWLDSRLASHGAVVDWLVFHTGARSAPKPVDAAFALVTDIAAMPPLDRFAQGTQEYPDRSTTLVMQLPKLAGGTEMTFQGPGIKGHASIAPRGLPASFADQWRANGERFPRGVDVILADAEAVLCLPRSARLVNAEG